MTLTSRGDTLAQTTPAATATQAVVDLDGRPGPKTSSRGGVTYLAKE